MTPLLPTADRSERGECRASRQMLELACPGEPESAALAKANRHIQGCLECQGVVRRRRHWDARLGTAFRDVPVPPDLAVRLLAALDSAAAPEVDVVLAPSLEKSTEGFSAPLADVGAAKGSQSRRRWLAWLVASAACALVGGGLWRYSTRPTIDLDRLVSRAAAADFVLGPLPNFPEGNALPATGSMNDRIVFDSPRQLAEGCAAVYFFRLPATRNGKAVRGRLLVVPVAKLINPPVATALLGSPAIYPGPSICGSMWVEGKFAYVCLVEGGEDYLRRLLPARPIAI